MAVVSLSEDLLQLAIEIEKSGAKFYSSASRRAREREAQDQFRHLAIQERAHESDFSDMLKRLARIEPQSYLKVSKENDYQYLKDVAASSIFSGDLMLEALSGRSMTDVEAVEIGIEAEKDSILFYSDMRGMLPRDEQALIDAITNEEKRHLSELNYVKLKLTQG